MTHLKRMAAPKSWPIERKRTVFVRRPLPGGQRLGHSLTLSMLLVDILKLARTSREARRILNEQEVLVNGRRARRLADTTGLFDVVTLPKLKASYRILINRLGKLTALPIAGAEASLVPSRISGKQLLAGKRLQLSFHNGRTMLAAKDEYNVGDTLLLKEGKETAKLPLAKGAAVLMIDGSHVGQTGVVETVGPQEVLLKSGDGEIRTTKEKVFVVGEAKPAFKIAP